jgi:predicted ester cyclase
VNDETSRNKGIVLGLFDDIWNGPRFDLIDEFYAPSFVADYRPYAPLRHGAGAVRTMVTAAWETFPDYYEELLSMIAEQNHVALYLRIVGSQRRAWGPLPATGRRLEFEEMSILSSIQKARSRINVASSMTLPPFVRRVSPHRPMPRRRHLCPAPDVLEHARLPAVRLAAWLLPSPSLRPSSRTKS